MEDMKKEYNERLLDVLAAIGRRVPPQEVRAMALTLKQDMTGEVAKMGRIVFTLDTNIGHYAPDPSWRAGYLFDDQGAPLTVPTRPRAYERKARVLEIANTEADEGRGVSTEEIAVRLRSEGDPAQALQVAVGNILNRAGWRRLQRGRYERVQADQHPAL